MKPNHYLSRILILVAIVAIFPNSTALADTGELSQNLEMKDQLLIVEEKIKNLSTSIDMVLNHSLYIDEEVRGIETQIIKTQIDLNNREKSLQNKQEINWNTSLQNSIGLLDKTKKLVKKNFKEKFKIFDLVQAIKNQTFKEAEDIWISIDNDEILPSIIHKIYANKKKNIILMIDFTKSLTTAHRKLIVLKTIWQEFKLTGEIDLFMIIQLIKIIESEVIKSDLTEDADEFSARGTHISLMEFLKLNATDMMVSAMLSKTFKTDNLTRTFLEQLYKLNSSLSNEIMFGVIDRVYGQISNNEIIDNIYFQCYIPQKEDALVYIYEKMSASKLLHTGVFRLAKYVKELNITKAKQHKEFSSIYEGLPSSIQSLFWAKSICIKNTGTSEYLYAASDHYSFDNDRRNVLTWVPGRKVLQGSWTVKLFDDKFHFINNKHSNEYMYASEKAMGFYKDFRHVFTWKSKKRVDSKKIAWNLQMFGNHLRIRNVFNHRLLCTTTNMYMIDRRYVFTLKDDFYIPNKDCFWEIESC